jgi:hypothetical protein
MAENLPVVAKEESHVAIAAWGDDAAAAAKAAMEQERAGGEWVNARNGQLYYQDNMIAGGKLDVVIVDSIYENVFYGEKYDPDNKQPPQCYAFGRDEKEMVPHPDAAKPQATKCSECQWNEFETSDNGKGKACKNTRRLALVAANPRETLASNPMAFFKPPVTSVKNWSKYVRELGVNKAPTFATVTTIGIVPDAKTQFKITFTATEILPAMQYKDPIMRRIQEAKETIEFPYPQPDEKHAAVEKKEKKERKF